jgi:subtilisin family serine protease
VKGKAWLPLALVVAVALFVLPSLAGAAAPGTVSLTSPDNESATAWFVQLSGKPTAEGASASTVKKGQDSFLAAASKLGLDVKVRHSFGTLWNGISISLPAGQVGSLFSVSGVTGVYPVRPFSLPPSASVAGTPADLGSNPMIGVDPTAGGVGPYQGQGVKVAVIDSGIDYTHPDLGGCFGPGCRVIGGYDLVGDSYDATATDPGYQPVPHPDPDPAPCDPTTPNAGDAGHGTHVAGIIGAKAAGPGGVTGVAPQVKFLAYRVFGCSGSTDNDNIVQALEMAYKDGAQVVNMSIGDDYAAWPEEPTAQTSDELVKKGVVVVAAEGNAGGVGTALFSGGDPGTGNDVIAVGSVDNAQAFFYELDVNGTLYPYVQAEAAPEAPRDNSTGTVVTAPDTIGCTAPAAGYYAGAIALIKRGTCTFQVKAALAQAAGASGVILYNNTSGFINPTVAGPVTITIPVVSILQADGNAIAGIAGTRTLTWTSNGTYVPQATGGLLSSFTSWGPTAELGLKPDVSAPGGLIRSTWPTTQYGGYNVISGTSMASPHVAGAAAVLLSAGKSPATVATLLSNYAEPTVWAGSPGLGFYDSPLRQGSGLIKVDRSIAATVTASPRKISLGEGLGGSQIVTVRNTGTSAVTYNLTYSTSVSPYPDSADWPNSFGFDAFEDTVAFSSPTVTVPAGGLATFTANVSIDPGTPDGELYGGYIQLLPTTAGDAITIPYAGYAGDYQAQQVLTGAGYGFPWLAKVDGTNLDQVTSDGQVFTLTNGDDPVIVFHLNLPATQFNVQIEKADGSYVHPVFNYADKESYLPRNATGTGFFTFAWDGTRGQDNGNTKTKTVGDGTYMLKMSVLKPLGDPNNSADWETFTTPKFTIDRP